MSKEILLLPNPIPADELAFAPRMDAEDFLRDEKLTGRGKKLWEAYKRGGVNEWWRVKVEIDNLYGPCP